MPPGNTTTATAVLRRLAAYIVIVGRLTSLALGHPLASCRDPPLLQQREHLTFHRLIPIAPF
jgi:hypothetical protein